MFAAIRNTNKNPRDIKYALHRRYLPRVNLLDLLISKIKFNNQSTFTFDQKHKEDIDKITPTTVD